MNLFVQCSESTLKSIVNCTAMTLLLSGVPVFKSSNHVNVFFIGSCQCYLCNEDKALMYDKNIAMFILLLKTFLTNPVSEVSNSEGISAEFCVERRIPGVCVSDFRGSLYSVSKLFGSCTEQGPGIFGFLAVSSPILSITESIKYSLSKPKSSTLIRNVSGTSQFLNISREWMDLTSFKMFVLWESLNWIRYTFPQSFSTNVSSPAQKGSWKLPTTFSSGISTEILQPNIRVSKKSGLPSWKSFERCRAFHVHPRSFVVFCVHGLHTERLHPTAQLEAFFTILALRILTCLGGIDCTILHFC